MARPRLPLGAHGAIKLEQVVPGKWRARTLYRFDDGKRRQVERTGATKAKAENALKNALTEMESPSAAGAMLKSSMTVAKLADIFLDLKQKEELSPNTLRVYEQHIRQIITPKLGALLVSQVKTMRVQTFINEVGMENGAGSASGCRTVLSGMFALAKINDLVDANPVLGVKGVRQKEGRAAKALTVDDMRNLIAATHADALLSNLDFPDIWEFMSLTGCRIGEACALTEAGVDFDTNTVTLGPSVAKIKGKPAFIYEDAKTDESKRTIVVPERAIELIRVRLDARPYTDEAVIFPDPLGRLYTPSKVEQIWARNRDRIGYPAFTSHGFRKTVATALDAAGLSARDIAEYLGHKRPSMTQDVYMSRTTQSKKAAIALGSMFGVSSE